MSCLSYAIQAVDGGPIKIGRADSVEARLQQLQTATPHELHLLATYPHCGDLERHLHRALESDRIRGEWFRNSGRLTQALYFAAELRGIMAEAKGRIEDFVARFSDARERRGGRPHTRLGERGRPRQEGSMTDLHDTISKARQAQIARDERTRVEGVDHAVEALQTFVRDGDCSLTVRIAGLDANSWDEIDADYARTPTGLELKREYFGPEILIEYVLDPDQSHLVAS